MWKEACMGHAVRMGEMRNAYKILAGKLEGKIQLDSGVNQKDNIMMDHREKEWEDVDWVHLAQERNE
jgi:hypothetical protein